MSDPVIGPVLVHVLTVHAHRAPAHIVSETDKGTRQFVEFTGGSFEVHPLEVATFTSSALSGDLVHGAAMSVLHSEELYTLDARYVLRAPGGHLMYAQALGRRFGEPGVSDRLRKGLPVKRSEYYGCSATTIETNVPGLEWMNYHQFLGNATSRPDGDTVRVYAVTYAAS